MRSFLRHSLAAFALIALMAAPSLAANKEHQQMMADIRMLQEQSLRLQQQLATLTEVLRTVSTKIDEQSGTNRKMFADQKLLIDGIAGDLRVVREKADDNNVRLGSFSQDLEALRQTIAQSAAAPPVAPPAGGVTPPAGETPPGNVVTPPQPPAAAERLGMLPNQLYQQAWSDYTSGQWDLAIQGFESYLKNAPTGPQSPDAQYYIGDSYYGGGKFPQAREAYQKVISNFPASSRVPEAYYKLGLVFERLNDRAHARETFQTLIDKYPADNQSVILAKQRLARLQGPGEGLEEEEP
jgi:tol-pal system protein YbgF